MSGFTGSKRSRAVLPSKGLDKLSLSTNFIGPRLYEIIVEQTTYADAVFVLKALFVKPTNEIFARHRLATHQQQSGVSLDEYLQALRTLAKDCNFKAVTAQEHRDESITDAFISDLR